MNLIKNKYLLLIVLFILSLIGIMSFFHGGFFPSHDGEWMVVRFSDFHRSLADGQWPVRWAGRLNFGFGYPVFNFLYSGTFYLTEIFHLLKLNFVNSVKATFVLSFMLSGFLMFLFAREWWGKWGGLSAAVLYLYTPYRFVDMYVRGSLGESVAFIFPPLILLAITKIWTSLFPSPGRRGNTMGEVNFLWVVIGALGMAGLITTHNVIAYLFLPITILFVLFLQFLCYSKKNVKFFTFHCLLLTILGLGVSAFFWLPALWDKQYTIFDKVVISDFSQNFASLKDLLFPSWGYGPSRPGNPNSMSFQIGIVNILIVISSLIMIVMLNLFQHLKKIPKQVRDDKINIAVALFFFTITLIAIFFMTPYSKLFWNIIPGLSLIQFPWRILSITTFCSSFLAGFVIKKFSDKKKLQIVVTVLLIVMAIILNFFYAKPKEFVDRGEGYYATNDDTTTVQNEYLPISTNGQQQKLPSQKVEILKGQGTINNLISKSNKTVFLYEGSNALIKINTDYFPGWEVLVNGVKQGIIVDKQGLINVEVQKGADNIELLFKETSLRKTADLISLISIIVVGELLVVSLTRKKVSV